MRAKEFVLNIPFSIRLRDGHDPEINMPVSVKMTGDDDSVSVANPVGQQQAPVKVSNLPPRDPSKLDPNPVMVPPLQQGIELEKADAGKTSPVVDELTQDETEPDKPQHFYNHDLLGEV